MTVAHNSAPAADKQSRETKITRHPAASGLERLALHLAYATNVPLEAAIGVLLEAQTYLAHASTRH